MMAIDLIPDTSNTAITQKSSIMLHLALEVPGGGNHQSRNRFFIMSNNSIYGDLNR
ncbi:hypothetical protein [Nonomuraea sp. NPDC050540]|uniref:hypothetical protein n=1 Tax=Nonomuraea sp. NPDC050540 TaxID=3364367 RepID=UPI003798AD6E